MALIIKTTGLEDYAPGGEARIKVLLIGGPGAGKTRMSSYFPKPIYADCEKGRASIADRSMPYVEIGTSTDMQDLLALLKQECRQPVAQRRFQTVVVDTLDAYQRKIKDEWMVKKNVETFTGWEAWGYLNSRMQTLMVRLLNLDMNVIVNVHYKDKKTKDDETGKESHELMLQLQGETADTAFNDFDLVGWMGSYWEAVEGQRVEKRGLTFKKTPDKPFLKDRLHVTPPWMEVTFADSDYTKLFDAIQSRVQSLSEGQIIGEVPSEDPAPPPPMVIAPGAVGTGPVAATEAREVPLSQMDKPTLLKLARDRGVSATVDGVPLKGNTLKSELVAALEAQADAPIPAAAATPPAPAEPTPTADPEAAPSQPVNAPAPAATPPLQVATTEAGRVDTATGQLLDEPEQAIRSVEQTLGGVVIAQGAEAPAPPTTPPAATEGRASVAGGVVCEVCAKDLAAENQDMVKLAWIKFRKRLCNNDYAARKNAGR